MKRYLRIMLKGDRASWFDVPIGEESIHTYSVALQAQGYLEFDKIWVPYDSILHMGIIEIANGGATITPLKPVS